MSEHTETKPSETAAPPTAVAAAGQKPAAKVSAESKAAVEPDKMRRRLIWACIWGYLGVNFLMFLRFFFPRTLFDGGTRARPLRHKTLKCGRPISQIVFLNELLKRLK